MVRRRPPTIVAHRRHGRIRAVASLRRHREDRRAQPPAARVNVLICAAGRRTALVLAFLAAAHDRSGIVVATDVDGLAPALFLADRAERSRRTSDPEFVDDLLAIVARHHIGVVVPTIDPDLPVLAERRSDFEALGCHLLVSSAAFIAICGDKLATVETFGARGIRVPRSWIEPLELDALPDRVFVKPRAGSASQHAYGIPRERLLATIPLVPRPIVQEHLDGREITVDALLDLDGRPIHFVPRARIKTVGGESVEGVTLPQDGERDSWILAVLEACGELGAHGPLTLQAFETADGFVLSEVNPRFGGGFPLGHAAGGDYPAWILDALAGARLERRLGDYRPNLYMTRAHVERFVDRPLW
jgi:carbamoyl-phosphate synthase large subunit